MALPTSSNDVEDFHLDIYAQRSRINRIYTQMTLCFSIADHNNIESYSEATEILTKGLARLSASFTWIAGKIVNKQGTWMIEPSNVSLVIKDFREDSKLAWEALQRANFPFSMLHERQIAPRNTMTICKYFEVPNPDLPVFRVQANLVIGGLLLTLVGQHGSMDMTGQGQVMHLFAKACRDEPFTKSELSVGNTNRKHVVKLLDENTAGPGLDEQIMRGTSAISGELPKTIAPHAPRCIWAYFDFSAASLIALKSRAVETKSSNSKFVSTDDVLTALVWLAITRSRLARLDNISSLNSSLIRTVDARRYLSLPSAYPGMITSSTRHTSAVDALTKQSLGDISVQLRSALDPASIEHTMRSSATSLAKPGWQAPKRSGVATSVPQLDVKLSSWAKENCYDLDFGFGKPTAVRRPQFVEGSREGLVYFLPKTLEGDIAVGVCLTEDDLGRLREDNDFAKYADYIG